MALAPAAVHTVEEGGEVLGHLVIDHLVAGSAAGGVRLDPQATVDSVLRLARKMTLKYGLLGLPIGGAKAALLCAPSAAPERRHRRLVRFFRALEPLLSRRVYRPGPDMGSTVAEIRDAMVDAGVAVKSRDLRATGSARATAAGVFAAAVAALAYRDRSVEGSRVAIHGLGAVGGHVAERFAVAGARVVAVATIAGSIYDPRGLEIRETVAAIREDGPEAVLAAAPRRRIEQRALAAVDSDVLLLCGPARWLGETEANDVAARIVCPAANDPWTPEGAARLERRGALVVPDFVANCGGALGSAMEFGCLGAAEIDRFVETFVGKTMTRLLARAEVEGESVRRLAEQVARERFERVRATGARHGPGSGLFGLGMLLHRSGLTPAWAMAPATRRYFRRTVFDSNAIAG